MKTNVSASRENFLSVYIRVEGALFQTENCVARAVLCRRAHAKNCVLNAVLCYARMGSRYLLFVVFFLKKNIEINKKRNAGCRCLF